MYTIFTFTFDGHTIRAITDHTNCWFPVIDVNAIFDVASPIRAVANFCAAKERADILLPDNLVAGGVQQLRETHCVNLNGLDALLGKARLDLVNRERFRCWFRNIVLHSLNPGDLPLVGSQSFYLELWSEWEFAEYACDAAEVAAVEGDPVLEERAANLLSRVNWDVVEAAGGERV